MFINILYSWTEIDTVYCLIFSAAAFQELGRQVEIYHIRSLHSDCDYQEKTQYKKASVGSWAEHVVFGATPKPGSL